MASRREPRKGEPELHPVGYIEQLPDGSRARDHWDRCNSSACFERAKLSCGAVLLSRMLMELRRPFTFKSQQTVVACFVPVSIRCLKGFAETSGATARTFFP